MTAALVAPASDVVPAVRPTTRDVLLERAALDAARTWAAFCCRELLREGRALEGGWPGTMPEARTRAGAEAYAALAKRSLPGLTHDELGRAARIVFDEARRAWQTAVGAKRRPRRRAAARPA